MKTRILFVTNTPIYGGAEKHLVDLILRLDESHADCTILCYESDVFSRYISNRRNVRVLSRNRFKPHHFFSYWLSFIKLKPQSIVFVNTRLGLFPWYAYLVARLSGARRLIAIEHQIADPAPEEVKSDGLWHSLRRLAGWRARLIGRSRLSGILSDQTICVSNAVRERLVNEYGYPASKTITILNGVDLKYYNSSNSKKWQSITASLDVDSSEAILVCIAHLGGKKRIDVLLKALSIVQQNHHSLKCLIVGSGPLESELRAYSMELGLANTVWFIGQVEDVRPYLQIADLFVLPSESEGLPLVLGEAMAYGVPCIASDVGGNREIIAHGHTGLIVKSVSSAQFAQAIDYLLVHREERVRMASNAKQRVQEHFNIDDTMEKVIKVLIGGIS